MSVRSTVAVAKRPGRRRISRRANLTSPSRRRRAPRPVRCAGRAGPRTTSWRAPSTQDADHPNRSRVSASKLQRDRSDALERQRQVEQRADGDAEADHDEHLQQQRAHEEVDERAPMRAQQGEACAPSAG